MGISSTARRDTTAVAVHVKAIHLTAGMADRRRLRGRTAHASAADVNSSSCSSSDHINNCTGTAALASNTGGRPADQQRQEQWRERESQVDDESLRRTHGPLLSAAGPPPPQLPHEGRAGDDDARSPSRSDPKGEDGRHGNAPGNSSGRTGPNGPPESQNNEHSSDVRVAINTRIKHGSDDVVHPSDSMTAGSHPAAARGCDNNANPTVPGTPRSTPAKPGTDAASERHFPHDGASPQAVDTPELSRSAAGPMAVEAAAAETAVGAQGDQAAVSKARRGAGASETTTMAEGVTAKTRATEGVVIRVMISGAHASFLHMRVFPSTTAGQVL